MEVLLGTLLYWGGGKLGEEEVFHGPPKREVNHGLKAFFWKWSSKNNKELFPQYFWRHRASTMEQSWRNKPTTENLDWGEAGSLQVNHSDFKWRRRMEHILPHQPWREAKGALFMSSKISHVFNLHDICYCNKHSTAWLNCTPSQTPKRKEKEKKGFDPLNDT